MTGLRVDLDGANDRELLAYYLGGFESDRGSDPFADSLAVESGGRYYIRAESLDERTPQVAEAFRTAAADGVIDWDEFERVVATTYYDVRPFPRNLQALKDDLGDWQDSTAWFGFSVNGVMAPNTRRIRVRIDDLEVALERYGKSGDGIVYPVGTTFVSEHEDGDRIIETSVMTRRPDGYWDFYAYGSGGGLLREVERTPRNLTVPTRCVGCHFGNRLFEPERSFPVNPLPAPDGPRRLYVPESMRNGEVVKRLDEHRRRSDRILGLYGTLFVSNLLSRRQGGTLSNRESSILDALGY